MRLEPIKDPGGSFIIESNLLSDSKNTTNNSSYYYTIDHNKYIISWIAL